MTLLDSTMRWNASAELAVSVGSGLSQVYAEYLEYVYFY